MSISRFVPHALFAVLVVFAMAWSAALTVVVPLPDGPNDFNSPGFVVRHAWVKFALLASRPFRDDLSRAEEDAMVYRFFQLNAEIADQARIGGDGSAPDAAAAARAEEKALRAERAGIENMVELILEGRLTRVIREAGLTRHVGGDIVWPPVSIEFQDPPSVLVKSPRSEIRKESESLLRDDLTVEEARRIEGGAERDGETSALVVEIGGIAMYPAIIPPSPDYRGTMDGIAHEWMHHYLFFSPLGRAYFRSAELTTLNETIADKVGVALGARLAEAYPLEPPAAVRALPVQRAAAEKLADGIDFTMEMRELRRQVEALLMAGSINGAEQLMDDKRAFFDANGIYIRRLNQAYFAFHGSYADSAGSIDPIGGKLDAVFRSAPSLRAFVATVREFTSEADLDRVVEAMGDAQ